MTSIAASDTAPPARRRPGVSAVAASLVLVLSIGFLIYLAPGATPRALAVLATAAIGGFALGILLRPPAGDPVASTETSGGGARVLVRQVIPVWQRTAELARTTAERNANDLTTRFANVHAQLDVALGATSSSPMLDGAAIDALVERHRPDLDRLRSDAREALTALAGVLDVARRVDDGTQTLARLAGDIDRIARASHILGLNASVEAARSGSGNGAFEVVASDVRELAAQSQRAARQMTEEVARMQERVETLRNLHRAVTKDDEDLDLRTELNARGVLRALLGSLGEMAQSSQVLRDAGHQAQCEIEAILMGLQGQDRINQMLQSVIVDLDLMRATLDDESTCAAASAADWLQRLEASYTMEEMRTSHHGTKSFEAQAAVEFF